MKGNPENISAAVSQLAFWITFCTFCCINFNLTLLCSTRQCFTYWHALFSHRSNKKALTVGYNLKKSIQYIIILLSAASQLFDNKDGPTVILYRCKLFFKKVRFSYFNYHKNIPLMLILLKCVHTFHDLCKRGIQVGLRIVF